MDILTNLLSQYITLSPEEIVLLERTFVLLLTLPIVSTIAGIFRYVIGLKSLSVYAPIILTFAFYDLGFIFTNSNNLEGYSNVQRGLMFGLLLYFVVFVSTIIIHRLLSGLRLHYIPKSSIILLGVTLSILLLVFSTIFISGKKGLIYLDIISIVVITTLSERLVSTMSRKGFRNTLSTTIETLIVSIFSYLFITLDFIQKNIKDNALLLVIILIVINLIVGSFLGLRLNEYWRFRSIIFKDYGTNDKSKSNTKK